MKVIVEAKPTPILNALKTANMVRLRQVQLENRNSNIRTFRFAQEPCCFAITTQLACIFKAFEDFRLVAQIREEIVNLQIQDDIIYNQDI